MKSANSIIASRFEPVQSRFLSAILTPSRFYLPPTIAFPVSPYNVSHLGATFINPDLSSLHRHKDMRALTAHTNLCCQSAFQGLPHRSKNEDKPTQSYISLIGKAILSSPQQKLVLSDIYNYILTHYPYFRNRGPGWRNSIRHNLSLNDCFVKMGRSPNGKGHFWVINPANYDDFSRGDYKRKRVSRRNRESFVAENSKGDGSRKMDETKTKNNDCKCSSIEIRYNTVRSTSEAEKRGFYRKTLLYKKD